MGNRNDIDNFEEVLSDVFSKVLGVDIGLIHDFNVLKVAEVEPESSKSSETSKSSKSNDEEQESAEEDCANVILNEIFSKVTGGADICWIHDYNVLKVADCDKTEVKSESNDEEQESAEQDCDDDIDIDAFASLRERFELAEEKFFNLEKKNLSVETTRRYEHPITDETTIETVTELQKLDDTLKTVARRTFRESFFINDENVEECEVFKKEDGAYICTLNQFEEYNGVTYRRVLEVSIEFFDC